MGKAEFWWGAALGVGGYMLYQRFHKTAAR